MSQSKEYCPLCQQTTNHKWLFNIKQKSESGDEFRWRKDYHVMECLGCENKQFKLVYSDESMVRFDEGDGYEYQYEEIHYFPAHLRNHSLLEYTYMLPYKLRIVYTETVEALRNNCYLLSAVGLRAIIEAICLEQKIAGRNLETKINNLVKNNLITKNDANRLHSIRFQGNDSVHDIDVPNEEKLRIALEILEHLIKNLYLIDFVANQHLDLIITNYDKFKSLVLRKLVVEEFEPNSELTLKDILGKDFRRIEVAYLNNFVQQLIQEINEGTLSTIALGTNKNDKQYFIKKQP
jgi:hypothetical protein